MKRLLAALAVTSSALGLGVTLTPVNHVAAAACSSWNLYSDFRTTPNQANPNPDSCGNPTVWSFAKSTAAVHNPANYALLSGYTDNFATTTGLDGWYNAASASPIQTPFVMKNTNATPATFAGSVTVPPHSIVVHPGSEASAAEGYYVVVGWTSPIAGSVSVTGGVSDDDPNGAGAADGIAWSIDSFKASTNTTLTSGSYPNGGAQAFPTGTGGPASVTNIPVAVGDVLYFVVDPGANYFNDSTNLDVTITASAPVNTPEAPLGALAFAGVGAAALAVWTRRSGRRRSTDLSS